MYIQFVKHWMQVQMPWHLPRLQTTQFYWHGQSFRLLCLDTRENSDAFTCMKKYTVFSSISGSLYASALLVFKTDASEYDIGTMLSYITIDGEHLIQHAICEHSRKFNIITPSSTKRMRI